MFYFKMAHFLFFLAIFISLLGGCLSNGVSDCGKPGKPHSSHSIIANGTVTYKCEGLNILEGDRERTCVDGQFTGSVPVCMPFMANDQIQDPHGSGSELINSENFKICFKENISLNFYVFYVAKIYVWTNASCSSISVNTSAGVFSSSNATPSQGGSIVFSAADSTQKGAQVKELSIVNQSPSCCVYRISFPNTMIDARCGTPDVPKYGAFREIDSTKGEFSCEGLYKVNDSSLAKCVGLEKWNPPAVSCVHDTERILLIALGALFVLLLILCSFCMGMWVVAKSEVVFDRVALFGNIIEEYPGEKIDYSEVSMLKEVEREPHCRVFLAQWRGKVVTAHVCQVSSPECKIAPLEAIRCLFQATQFSFKHPNLVTLLAISNDPKRNPIIVYEFYGKGRLDQFLRHPDNKTFSVQKLAELALDVCNGMMHLADMKIVHRDLRAKSCYVDDNHSVKVGNFIHAQALGQHDQFQCKDPVNREQMPWAAPETLAENLSSRASDVWAFGVLLWEIFSHGQIPFGGMSEEEITMMLLNEQRLDKPSECPTEVYTIMTDCWKTGASERPSFNDLSRRIKALTN